MSKNIFDFNQSYGLVKRYMMTAFRGFYGDYVINGKENIPAEGPVIYAANHLNALMDPLAVISALPHKMPIVYLARADYFKKKTTRQMLTFCKLLPAFRMRDGVGNLEKNHGIFEKCVEVLENNRALGIMPEGNQGSQRKIRPLVKGIFRIAFTAQQKYGTEPGVKIVPVGIDFGDFEKFGKHLIINVGKPIEVSEFMITYNSNPVKATNHLRDRLSSDLSSLTLNLATESHYDCFETATEVANTNFLTSANNTLNRFFTRQKIAEKLLKLEKHRPELIEKLDAICSEYRDHLKKLNLRSWVLEKKQYKRRELFMSILLLLITLPVFVIGFIVNMFPFFTPDLIRHLLKINFPGGISSLRFGLGMITFPVFYLIQGVLIYRKFRGELWNLILIIPLQYVFGKLSYQWYRGYQRHLAKIRYRRLEKQKSPELIKIKQLHDEIIQIVQQAS